MTRDARIQFVWWGLPLSLRGRLDDGSEVVGLMWTRGQFGVSFWRPDPESSWSSVLMWRLLLGPLEIRKYVPDAGKSYREGE